MSDTTYPPEASTKARSPETDEVAATPSAAPEALEAGFLFSGGDASGVYAWPKKANWQGWREEIRLDVDGRYPQMTVSGRAENGLANHVHWIASVAPAGRNRWQGTIWFKEGSHAAQFLYTTVKVKVVPSIFVHLRRIKVTFSGGGAPIRVRKYRFKSDKYHSVEFEYDTVENAISRTEVQTCNHPNRPPGLPCENLTIKEVFERSGFQVSSTGGDGVIPLAEAGVNGTWSDAEMHDAMQAYWSRFANHAQWSMWVLFAARHDSGPGLGGIMFDDIGPNHRQGTAMFSDSFISDAPPGDPDPVAWVERMQFWTAVHEMGHAFNLAHSWQKHLGNPWIPLVSEPEARSFMNYPYFVLGGQSAFFADFEYRFSDQELLFMRHAPDRFVQMGNADWFDDHGFRQANISPSPELKLELRTNQSEELRNNRSKDEFEYMEGIVLETKLTNVSSQPILVNPEILAASDEMTVILKKQGKPARQWTPYARYCRAPNKVALEPGQSLYKSLFVSAGQNGWDIAEPGIYHVQVLLRHGEEDIPSNALKVRVAPPRSHEEEYLAQDYFSDDVGRVLSFDGSQVLTAGNNALQEVVARMADSRTAIHARVALAEPKMKDYKTLPVKSGQRDLTSAAADKAKFDVSKADVGAAKSALDEALLENADVAADSLGHVDFKDYVDGYTDWLSEAGDPAGAAKKQAALQTVLTKRGVKKEVVAECEQRQKRYKAMR